MPKYRSASTSGYAKRHVGPYLVKQGTRYVARKLFGGGTATATRNNTRKFTSTGITTAHYDKKLKYRYKRMPRRKRRRYVRQSKFVKHVIDTQRPISKVCTATKFPVSAALAGQTWHASFQCMGIPVINAPIATSVTHNAVVNGYQQLKNVADATNGDTLYNDQWKQTSYVCQITITNHGATTMLVDSYRVVCKKSLSNSSYKTPYISNGVNETTAVLDMENGLTGVSSNYINQLGVTPFSVTSFTKYFKILQVKEIQVPAGDTITLSYRIPRNYLFKMSALLGKVFLKGITQGYLFRFKGVAATEDAWPSAVSATVLEEKAVCVTETTPSTWAEQYGSHA